MDFAKSPVTQVKEPKGPTLTLLSTGILGFIAPHKCCIFWKVKARLSTIKDYNSLYYGGLEENPQYLQGMTILML